jgi:hypothetical protein
MEKTDNHTISMVCPTFTMFNSSVKVPAYIIDGEYYELFQVRYGVEELRPLKVYGVCSSTRKDLLEKLEQFELNQKQNKK